MKRAWVLLLVATVAGLALGGGLMTAVQLPRFAEAQARLRAVQAYLASQNGWSLEQAKAFLEEVKNLKPPQNDEATQLAVQALQMLSEFEQKYIPVPVIYANQADAKDLLGKEAIIYGTVSRVTLSQSGHLFVDVGNWTVVKWRANEKPEGLEVGKAIAAYGTVKEYQGKPEIIVQDLSDIVF